MKINKKQVELFEQFVGQLLARHTLISMGMRWSGAFERNEKEIKKTKKELTK